MEPEPTTALKRLYAAVLVLASEEGSIEERLRTAYVDHLHIPVDTLPEHLRGEWRMIDAELRRMYSAQMPPEDISHDAAVDIAQRVLLVYDSLIR
jgi:hypothetical protein